MPGGRSRLPETGAGDAVKAALVVTAAAEPARAEQAVSAEDLAWEGPRRQAPPSDVPLLRVAGFEGPLDWLLEQTRAGRIDLARLPVLALIEQCVAALDGALAQRRRDGGGSGTPVPLQRLADWVIMAAWLAWLRSRLLLPADDPEAQAARDEAEALRRRLADRAHVREAVAWLDAQPQLGRDVFARGGVPTRAAAERAADLPALLRTYARLMGPLPEQEKEDVYRPCLLPLWHVPDALARMEKLLPELLGAAPDDTTSLWRFLPDREMLDALAAAAGSAGEDRTRPCRSAVASTLVAALELARQGRLTLAQQKDEGFGAIDVHAIAGAAGMETGNDATGDAEALDEQPQCSGPV